MNRERSLRLARALVRLAALIAPRANRDRLIREWDAELLAESIEPAADRESGESLADSHAPQPRHNLLRCALGAFADARTLRSIERARSLGGGNPMLAALAGWLDETRIAIRSLARAPGYTVVAVVTLGLGLGGSAAIYTLISRVVLSPLPYPEPERLVKIDNPVPGVGADTRWNTSTAQYVYFADHAETLESVGIYYLSGANLQTPFGPERVRTAGITAEMLDLLGARAQHGRLFTTDANRPEGPSIVVLSHEFWTRALSADASILGRTIELNGYPAEVVGILEPGINVPDAPPGYAPDVWRPTSIDRAATFYNSHPFRMIARLAAGADTTAVEAELARLTQQLPEAFPAAYRASFFERTGFHSEATPLKSAVIGDAAKNLWIVFAGVVLVLLVASANVANLFLVRMETSRREIAVRTALGAGVSQVARYLSAEALVLAGSGAALALVVSYGALRALARAELAGLPRMDGIGLDGSTVGFTALLAVMVAVGIALHPILLLTRGGASDALAEGGRMGAGGHRASRFRSMLVVTQVAVALVLAVSAGLLVETMRKLTAIDSGVDAEGVLTLRVDVSPSRYTDDPALWRLYRDVLERVRQVPGVVAAGMSAEIPLDGGFACWVQAFPDPSVADRLREAGLTTCAGQEPTTPGYFEAMGIPVLAGRSFEDADLDDPTRAAVVVSRAFADRFWPGEDPIGKQVGASGNDDGYHTVIGVVGDVPAEKVEAEPAVAVYYPLVLNPEAETNTEATTMRIAVKTDASDPLTMLPSIREAVAQVDPSIPLTDVRPMQDVVDASMAQRSFIARLLGTAAGTALLLSGVGLYGVVSYAVSRRRREIGMRLAIGARPAHVEWMVVRQSLVLALLGLAIGTAASLSGMRVLSGLLYGVSARDPRILVTAASLLLTIAVCASWVPAKRAARMDPAETLREG
jgi:putative ABC transport system permease protein